MNDNTPTETREFVLRRIADGLSVGGHDVSGKFWYFILGAVLAVGIVYVVWMYVRDGQSIGRFWGAFLALLRLSVYATLGFVFLLPAYQNSVKTEKHTMVLLAYDISGSMSKQDDPVSPGQDPAKRLTRQQKVLRFLGDPAARDGFFQRLQKENPLAVYRLGTDLDQNFIHVQDGKVWERKEWEEVTRDPAKAKALEGRDFTQDYLKDFLLPVLQEDGRDNRKTLDPLMKGTNLARSLDTLVAQQGENMVQGIVLFTDGRSTEGGKKAREDLAAKAKDAKMPVFVVVVGEDRAETKLEIVDARGPDKVRPNDPFPVSVSVTGTGLSDDRDVTVYLDVYLPGQDPKKKDKPVETLKETITLRGAPLRTGQVEFQITPAVFGETVPGASDKPGDKTEKKPDKQFKVGDWRFVPRVRRDPGELTNEEFHTTPDPVLVKVEDKSLRVLLVASAPTRDYQFVRTMLVREFDKGRLELAIYLQPLPGQAPRLGIVQDIPPARLLKHFPDKMDDKVKLEGKPKTDEDKPKGDKPKGGKPTPADEAVLEDALYNLASYDVILAFDPNWADMSIKTELVERWVNEQGGGLVVVAGPIHTLELARVWAAIKPDPGDPGKARRAQDLIEHNFEVGRQKKILDLYPVLLKDSRLEKDRNTAVPAGLDFRPGSQDLDFLKLDEENKDSGLTAAWEEFFGRKPAKEGDKPIEGKAQRGFYGYYPVEKAVDTARVVAVFKDDASADKTEAPYLVIKPHQGLGRVVWLGSGETWRLRQFREVWHERFWTKLARYASGGSLGSTTSRRIVPRVPGKFKAGEVEIEAQFFQRDLTPLPPTTTTKPRVVLRPPIGVTLTKTEFEMKPKKRPGENRRDVDDKEGFFTVSIPEVKTAGKYGLDIILGEPNEPPHSRSFDVIDLDVEMQDTRPDIVAASELASDAEDVLGRVKDPETQRQIREKLRRFLPAAKPGDKPAGAAKDKPQSLRLVFDLESANLIPECLPGHADPRWNPGKVDDLWDDGWVIRQAQSDDDKPLKISYVLTAVVGLLSVEWLTRKLLRLA